LIFTKVHATNAHAQTVMTTWDLLSHAFSRDNTVLPTHPAFHLQVEWAIPPFAFPAIAGTHLPTPEGWKAE